MTKKAAIFVPSGVGKRVSQIDAEGPGRESRELNLRLTRALQ